MSENGSTVAAKFRHAAWNLFLITLGSLLCAVGVNGILIPHHFLSGGFTGFALIIFYLSPYLPVSVLYFLLNIPLFCLGWMFVGRRFFYFSIAGMIIFSLAIELTAHVTFPVNDRILGALLAGIVIGTGSGIILRSYGSAGGTDILSVILLKKFSIRLGTTVLAFNSLILAASAILFSLEGALYTLIYLYVLSHMVNLVVTGLSQRKSIIVISDRWEAISREIMDNINRGVTILMGQGGYTGREERILYSVVTFQEISRIKRLIRKVDPQAFVVVSDTLEVMGHRIGNHHPW
jgi:uncharacterized membrane-anchored protein YitT (DUF2179 family)